MATTTNFGWETPDDTDLVKDGALAMRTLGNAIDASLVDLKGGTTGQVLAKASNTDLDYTWVTQDDANAIQNAIVDAKGDLIAASAADTPARLAVGNNGDTLVADSSASTGLRWQGSMAAGKNLIINGGFDIWQRGTSSTTNSGYLTADRWTMDSANCTKSQQTTGSPNGSRYVFKNAFTSASGAYSTMIHLIETANASMLWGKTVTFSVKLRRNAAMVSNLAINISKSSTVDAGTGASWTSLQTTTVTNASLPTGTGVGDWFTATCTTTIPNDGTANSIRLYIATSTEPGNSSYWEAAQAQLEIGSVATEFSRAGGTLAGELAACQRYYWRVGGDDAYQIMGNGIAQTTSLIGSVFYPNVPLRVKPTSIEYSTLTAWDMTGNFLSISNLTIDRVSKYGCLLTATVSGAVLGRFYNIAANNSTSGYVALNAEL